MRFLFILALFTNFGCSSITKRDLTPLSVAEIKRFQPQNPRPVTVYVYGDLGSKHPSYMRADITNLIRKSLEESNYFSEVEVINVSSAASIWNQDKFDQVNDLSHFFIKPPLPKDTIVTVYFRELEQEVSFGFVMKMIGSVLTLGAIPVTEESHFITGVRIAGSNKKPNFDQVYHDHLEAATTSLPLSGYRFGLEHLYQPVADVVMAALVDYSKNGGWND